MKRPDLTDADAESMAKQAVLFGSASALAASTALATSRTTVGTMLTTYAAHRQCCRGLRATATPDLRKVYDRIDALQDETGHFVDTSLDT